MTFKKLLTGFAIVLGFAVMAGPRESQALTYVRFLQEPGTGRVVARSYRAPVRTSSVRYVNSGGTHRPAVSQFRSYSSRAQLIGDVRRQLAPYSTSRAAYLNQTRQSLQRYTVRAPRTSGHGHVGHVNGGLIRGH